MNITPVLTKDIEDYASLFCETFNQPPWNENWTKNRAIARLNCIRQTPHFVGIAAYDNNVLVGFIFGNHEPYEKKSLYFLKEMCINPEHQRCGIGSRLLKALHWQLLQENIDTINLITRINSDAESFYLHNGYYQSPRMGLFIKKLAQSPT